MSSVFHAILRDLTHSRSLKIGLVSASLLGLLFALRVMLSGELKYGFMAWNMSLAFIAWGLGICFAMVLRTKRPFAAKVVLGIAWLLFLPNTFYILTDLIHPVLVYPELQNFNGQLNVVPDGTMILLDGAIMWVSASAGWYLGLMSMSLVNGEIRRLHGRVWSHAFVALVGLLVGFGIYLGRSPRLNSWDIVSRPMSLYDAVTAPLKHPILYSDSYAITLLFFILVYVTFLCYELLKTDRGTAN